MTILSITSCIEIAQSDLGCPGGDDFFRTFRSIRYSYDVHCEPVGRLQVNFYELVCLLVIHSNTLWYGFVLQRISDS